MASGYSTDIELARPMFGGGPIPGVDAPTLQRPGTIRWGFFSQYAMEPLTLYSFDEEVGAVVSNRVTNTLGISVDITSRLTARLSMPIVTQWGSDTPSLESNGTGIGDIQVGAHYIPLDFGVFYGGLRADVFIPTASKAKYMGERNVRGAAALLAMVDVGRLQVATDLGVMLRGNVNTNEDLTLGSELVWNTGLRGVILPDTLGVSLTGFARFGFANFATGAGENPLELVLNVDIQPIQLLKVDVGVGRGFTQGYGTTDLRAYLGLTFQHVPKPKVVAEDEEDAAARAERERANTRNFQVEVKDETIEEPQWEEGQLAKIDKEQIIIRDAIRFQVGTAGILEESLPTMTFIAGLLNGNALIGHVVIEGHASEEGEFDTNYELSVKRAQSIWRQLIVAGVHPDRISYRGYGELNPADVDQNVLAASRRVEFHIIHQFEDWEDLPRYRTSIQLPWNGVAHTVKQPRHPDQAAPTAPAERPTRVEEPAIDDFEFEGGDEDFDMDDTDDPPDTGDKKAKDSRLAAPDFVPPAAAETNVDPEEEDLPEDAPEAEEAP